MAHTIHIIGAGIAGLTAALSFSAKGHHVEIIEQAPALSEVGAGLQISPNASRILIELGLGPALDKASMHPASITLISGHSLRKIAEVPCGDFAARRWGAPYGVMHRSDLQALLLNAVTADPNCALRLDRRIEAADLDTIAMPADRAADGLIVGADGVWSQTRRRVPNAATPRFSGQIAWRFKVSAELAGAVVDRSNVTAFLAPRSHLVAYPLENGKTINMVAIAAGKDPGQTWAARENPTDCAGLLAAFGDWNSDITDILRQAPEMTWWPLFEMADGGWFDGTRTILIGDAAHAMTPFAAQGAAMAIEDGYELAEAVGAPAALEAAEELTARLSRYEAHRRARIGRARNRAAFNRFAYHARGPIRLGRNLVLALKPAESLAADLDWLYGYRATGL